MASTSVSRWLLKTEPDEFSWDDLTARGREPWTGVKGQQALRNIAKVELGDEVFIYHTGKEKSIVGVGIVASEVYVDPHGDDPKLLAFDVVPRYPLVRRVTLTEVKAEPSLSQWSLVRLPRLSVMPVDGYQWNWVHEISGTVLAHH